MLRGWSRNATNKSKIVDGRHLEKSKTRDVSASALVTTNFDEIWHGDVTMDLRNSSTIKINGM